MNLIVMKFGGSSVANAARLERAAERIVSAYHSGACVVAVVSAQGDTTDELIKKAGEISPRPPKREMDVLLSAGEQISMSLLAMAIEKEGVAAISLTGWQAEIFTDGTYGNARIQRVIGERITRELDDKKIVIVAGFQGIDKRDNITTLGRGGSDTTAVSIAAALRANICEIYTDVDGIYTADPRIVENAYKLPEISYDEMLELASLGANVLHNRSVEMAMKYGVPLAVRSSFNESEGTIVKEVSKVEKMYVRGVTRDNDAARVTLFGLERGSGKIFDVFELLARKEINVDIILMANNADGSTDLSFTVAESQLGTSLDILEKNADFIGAKRIESDENLAKVSVVGAGMASNPGVAAMAFGAMSDAGIDISMISTSEIKISMIVAEKDAERGVNALHEKFLR
ncbi:MAG: aspartate kinase [Clostridiales bacterium]|jgi:aspartate kinase|nr:aspartate kinase [Clostridiales bacterium]